MHFVSVVGTRPQLVKASAIAHELNANWPQIRHTLIHTGQHYDDNMSGAIISSVGLNTPDINLATGSGSHGEMTGLMIAKLEEVLLKLDPDWCLNYGDTNTTLATALAAVKINVKLAHVEAGLRRYDLSIPEEVNRRLTDHVSNVLFASSTHYALNLEKEAVPGEILTLGDITFDTFRLMIESLKGKPRYSNEEYALCTIHRPINTDFENRLSDIMRFLSFIPCQVILPIHPRTAKKIQQYGQKFPNNVKVVEPVSYDYMLHMLRDCKFVVTDSGGLQKEAFFAKKRCITLNKDTPWIELREQDVNRPIEPHELNYAELCNWLNEPIQSSNNPYGDGNSRSKMVKALVDRIIF